jgi:phenylpyruvate tautomerase PptA (4-oxalocrotonate tautomerase family)
MPYSQLDTPFSYSTETKQRLAKRLGEIYSEKINSNLNRITVAIRELSEGSIGAVAKEIPGRRHC